jgi:hypothetical protein
VIRRSVVPIAVASLALAWSSAAGGAEATSTRKQRPHYAWNGSYKAVVDQTAAVVEGTVARVEEFYSEEEGPRTLVTLSASRCGGARWAPRT